MNILLYLYVMVGKPEGKNHSEDAGKWGRIILELISEK
jgi:hypothetical protein